MRTKITDLEELLFYDGEELERNKLTIKILQTKLLDLIEMVKSDIKLQTKEINDLLKIDPELRGDERLDYEFWTGAKAYTEKIKSVLGI